MQLVHIVVKKTNFKENKLFISHCIYISLNQTKMKNKIKDCYIINCRKDTQLFFDYFIYFIFGFDPNCWRSSTVGNDPDR